MQHTNINPVLLFPETKSELDRSPPGLFSHRLWCKAREQKVVYPASAEEWSSTALNWCSDQRGIRAKEPAAPGNTVIQGMPRCCSRLSWLMTSPFDPSRGSWQVPWWSRHKRKVHTFTKVRRYHCTLICQCMVGLMSSFLGKQRCSAVWIKMEGNFICQRYEHKHMRPPLFIHYPAMATQSK